MDPKQVYTGQDVANAYQQGARDQITQATRRAGYDLWTGEPVPQDSSGSPVEQQLKAASARFGQTLVRIASGAPVIVELDSLFNDLPQMYADLWRSRQDAWANPSPQVGARD